LNCIFIKPGRAVLQESNNTLRVPPISCALAAPLGLPLRSIPTPKLRRMLQLWFLPRKALPLSKSENIVNNRGNVFDKPLTL
jgi:hypothetical protein